MFEHYLGIAGQIGGILTDLSFVGSFCLALYGLRKPRTRQHLQMALARLARAREDT